MHPTPMRKARTFYLDKARTGTVAMVNDLKQRCYNGNPVAQNNYQAVASLKCYVVSDLNVRPEGEWTDEL